MAMERDALGRLLPGSGGRKIGAKDKLHRDVVTDALESWKKHGKAALEILFHESPRDYTRFMSGILPKEYFFQETSPLSEMSEDDLERDLAIVRAQWKEKKENLQ